MTPEMAPPRARSLGADLAISHVPPAALTPAPYNPRSMTDEARARLRRGIETFGLVDPIIARRSDGLVIGGHQRLHAAQEIGLDTVPVVYLDDVDDDRAAALNVLLNNPSAQGTWDMARLSELLSELDGNGFDATLTGFDAEALEGILSWTPEPERAGEESPDVDLTPPAEAKSERGKVYELGRHRLVCGDSTDAATWDALAVPRPAMVFTSPPYGVGENAKLREHYVPGAAERKSLYASHDDAPESWRQLMMDWTGMALAHADVVVCNVQMLANNKRALVEWMHELRTHIVDVAVWDKAGGAPQMQANVLTNAFEWVVILSPEPDASRAVPLAGFHGTIANVVRVDPRGRNEFAGVHGAVMPVDLARWALGLCPKAAHVVDPFGGTGTTLVAAEQMGRTAYLIEKDATYCDVIRRRYAELVGRPELAP